MEQVFSQARVSEPPKPEKGFLSNVQEDISKRREKIKSAWTPAQDEGIAESFTRSPSRYLQTAGQAAASIGDVIGQGLKSAYKAIVPEQAQETIAESAQYLGKNIVDSYVGKMGIEAAKDSYESYQVFKKHFPDAAKDLEAVVNIATLLPMNQTGRALVKGGEKVLPMLSKGNEVVGQGGLNISKGAAKLRNKITPAPSPEEALGQVIQGKTTDLAKGKEALGLINTKGVKTFSDLNTRLSDKIPELAKAVDNELLRDSRPYTMDRLTTVSKSGGTRVEQNFVQNALEHLDELYSKTGDGQGLAGIKGLAARAGSQGLTKKEINDLARQYGVEFGQKAFSKMGDPLTSVNAQLYENVRKGLKEVARRGMSDTAKELDGQMSAIFNTQRLIQKNMEAAQKLAQKVDPRTMGEKVGRAAAIFLDTITGRAASGFISKFFPSNVGLKQMNFLQLQDKLERNLKILRDAHVQVVKRTPDKPKMLPPPPPVDAEFAEIAGKSLPPGQGFEMGASYGPRGLPAGQGFERMDTNAMRSAAVEMSRGLPPGQEIKLLPEGPFVLVDKKTGTSKTLSFDELNTLRERLGIPPERLGLPPGPEPKQIPRFTGSAKSLEEIRGELPKMYQGERPPVSFEEMNPELAGEVSRFTLRGANRNIKKFK
jgi:hypothetical protein